MGGVSNSAEDVHADEHVNLLAEKTANMLGIQFEKHPWKFLYAIVQDYSGTQR